MTYAYIWLGVKALDYAGRPHRMITPYNAKMVFAPHCAKAQELGGYAEDEEPDHVYHLAHHESMAIYPLGVLSRAFAPPLVSPSSLVRTPAPGPRSITTTPLVPGTSPAPRQPTLNWNRGELWIEFGGPAKEAQRSWDLTLRLPPREWVWRFNDTEKTGEVEDNF